VWGNYDSLATAVGWDFRFHFWTQIAVRSKNLQAIRPQSHSGQIRAAGLGIWRATQSPLNRESVKRGFFWQGSFALTISEQANKQTWNGRWAETVNYLAAQAVARETKQTSAAFLFEKKDRVGRPTQPTPSKWDGKPAEDLRPWEPSESTGR
jgi:hypothetical protein